jgi:hypothetical protein
LTFTQWAAKITLAARVAMILGYTTSKIFGASKKSVEKVVNERI